MAACVTAVQGMNRRGILTPGSSRWTSHLFLQFQLQLLFQNVHRSCQYKISSGERLNLLLFPGFRLFYPLKLHFWLLADASIFRLFVFSILYFFFFLFVCSNNILQQVHFVCRSFFNSSNDASNDVHIRFCSYVNRQKKKLRYPVHVNNITYTIYRVSQT